MRKILGGLRNEIYKPAMLNAKGRDFIMESKLIFFLVFIMGLMIEPSLILKDTFLIRLLSSIILSASYTTSYYLVNFLLIRNIDKEEKGNEMNNCSMYVTYLLVLYTLSFSFMLTGIYLVNQLVGYYTNEGVFLEINDHTFIFILFKIFEIIFFIQILTLIVIMYTRQNLLTYKENIEFKKEMEKHDIKKGKLKFLELNNDRVLLKGLNKREFLDIKFNDFLYIKSEGHYIKVYYFNERTKRVEFKTLRNSLKNLLFSLPQKVQKNKQSIIRVHKSYLVNAEQIKYTRNNSLGGTICLKVNNIKLPLSKIFVEELKQNEKIGKESLIG